MIVGAKYGMRRVTFVNRSWLTLLGLSLFFSGVFLAGIFQLAPGRQIYAQEGGVDVGETVYSNPKIRVRNVTATVPDNAAPTTPILIAPPNNSIITDSTPSFVWEAATDDQGISKYVLFVDGSIKFDNIPISDTTNANYVLTYDSGTGRYTLTPTAGLTDGTHTWKIQAWDTSSHSTDSVTWTFTIDTTAPSFVVNQIGTATGLAISAQDVSTIPLTPLILTANEPLIVATGEASSVVQTTLVIPGDPTQNFTTTIDVNGNWTLQLGILPRGVVMTLNFLITDTAGNLSILNGVEFMIEQDVIVFPPVSPTPTPEPTEPPSSPTPGVTPEPSSPPSPPSTPAPSPFIVIPITPPRETIYLLIQDLIDRLPDSVQDALETLGPIVEDLAPISAAVVALAVPIMSTIAVATQFGGSLSPTLLLKILQALGLLPIGKPQGLVFNSETDEGVPFAILTFRSKDPDFESSIVETMVTDTDGIYKGINLPAGTYQLEVSQQDFHFPTSHTRPAHLAMSDYYRGEEFELTDKQEPLFLIPVDPLVSNGKHRLIIKARLFFARLTRQTSFILYPLAFLSAILVILFPTVWNMLVFGLYAYLVTRRAIFWFKIPIITGQVVDEQGQPMEKVIVRLATVDENALAAVLLTDTNGEFRYYGQPDVYQLSLQKLEYVWMENKAALSFYQVDVRAKREHVVASLTPLRQVLNK